MFMAGDVTVNQGDWVTIDGTSGEIILGKVKTIPPSMSDSFTTFMEWVDKTRRLKVRTNADTPKDCQTARDFGAEGIGLCRTEHMFFEPDRIIAVRRMILAKRAEGRKLALKKILPMQRKDFEELFRVMKGFPVTIRLLDPPLHEFIPHDEEGQAEVAKEIGVSVKEVKKRVEGLHEFNPMLGHRGCRLGITYPEIYEMQVRAIMEAACYLVRQEGFTITPEIMIPLVGHRPELEMLREKAEAVCQEVMKEMGQQVDYLIGTMIELPRAALRADEIAKVADFFSFGTNDLTTMGISRDDVGAFLDDYLEKGILDKDPFKVLDQKGVGQLVEIGVEKGRATRKNIKLGVCGEHGGNPPSIDFFERVGLDYVSCSPYRVPIARLAAAQAAISNRK